MVKKKSQITAGEFLKKLNANPEFVASQKKREEALQERVAKFHAEQEPIVLDLHKAGIDIQYLSDLISRSLPYPNAIPILERHLLLPYSDGTLETLARALAVPDSRSIWATLVEVYRKTPNYGADGQTLSSKDGLALALAAAVTPATLNELIDLIFDTANGESRIFFLAPLRRSKSQYAQEAIQKLAFDPALTKEIASWKRKKK